jgi:hypothetical protein
MNILFALYFLGAGFSFGWMFFLGIYQFKYSIPLWIFIPIFAALWPLTAVLWVIREIFL